MKGERASTTGNALCREGSCWQYRRQLCSNGEKGLSSFSIRASMHLITSAKGQSATKLIPWRTSFQCPDHTPIALGAGHSFLSTKPCTSSSTASSAASAALSPGSRPNSAACSQRESNEMGASATTPSPLASSAHSASCSFPSSRSSPYASCRPAARTSTSQSCSRRYCALPRS